MIDIHNQKRILNSAKKRLDKDTSISQYNKRKIFEYVEDKVFSSNIGKARSSKILSNLRSLTRRLNKDFNKLTEKEVRKIISTIINHEKYTAWTKKDFKTLIKGFFKWGNEKTYWNIDVSFVKTSLKERDIPRLDRSDMLEESEIHHLIDCLENARDKAFISLLWDTGARIGEIGSMTIGSVIFEDNGTIIDLRGKTGKRTIFVLESTKHLLGWLNLHPDKDNKKAPLWVSLGQNPVHKNKSVGYRTLYKILQRGFQKADIKKNFNPHLFRHSRALWCAINNWNVVLANKHFGWGMNSRMYNYYCSLSTQDVAQKMKECYGIKPKETIKQEKRICSRCDSINECRDKFCFKCGMTLDIKTAITRDKLEKQILAQPLKAKGINDIKEAIFQSIKGTLLKDSEFLEQLKNIKR